MYGKGSCNCFGICIHNLFYNIESGYCLITRQNSWLPFLHFLDFNTVIIIITTIQESNISIINNLLCSLKVTKFL